MNKIEKIEETALVKVINDGGLAIEEGEIIKTSYQPFLQQLAEIQEQATKINFEAPVELDETIARELRLKTVKIRTGAEKIKEERKRGYLLKGNLEQAAYNLISASCKLTEEAFNNVEKAREIAEKKRIEALRLERTEKLTSVVEDPEQYKMFPLGEMSEQAWNDMYTGLVATKKAKEEAAAKAEAEKIETERLNKLENVRRLEIAPYSQFMKAVYDLRTMNEVEYSELHEALKRAKNDYNAEQEKIRLENIRLQNEIKEKELIRAKRNKELRPYIIFIRDYNKILNLPESEFQKEFADIKIGAELQWAEDIKKAQQEAKDKANSIRIAKELQDKKDSELKAEQEKQAAEKARLLAEKAAAKAPEREKLLSWLNGIKPTVDIIGKKSDEATALLDEIIAKFQGFKKWAENEINKL